MDGINADKKENIVWPKKENIVDKKYKKKMQLDWIIFYSRTHSQVARLFILTSGQTGIVRPVCPYFLLFE